MVPDHYAVRISVAAKLCGTSRKTMYARLARGDFEDQTPETTASITIQDVNKLRGRPVTWRDVGWCSSLMAAYCRPLAQEPR